ncbi:CD209 antigen-like protein C isoform X2 [Siniperca chuatsi]|uniref:CD209 antigen-like protein C isoform X2 n=1 Tax=Siniperca chuatsi TaxID=119488 RepID=UPI001CE13A70|nr:CD209 antigen-like protein C isoform X2 [Siniperca chuatsi]
MPEADVVYSDVKFTREREIANGTISSLAETTYSEVRISKTQPSTELPASQQQAASNGGSKVTSERVALVVLSALLAAAVIALGVTSHQNIQTMGRVQNVTDDHEAVKKNLTETLSELKSCYKSQKICPQCPAQNISEPCLKCEEGWEQHEGKCYYFSTSTSAWEKSRDECRQQGGDLVKIDSRDEQEFLDLKLREKMNQDEDKFWIGLTDSKQENTWLWADGSPLNTSLSFWSGNEPDNWKGDNADGEDCARMGEKAGAAYLKGWFDKSCKVSQRSICEKAAQTGRVMLHCSSLQV